MASDSDSEEDFVTYGTPLEPLEEDEPLKKPVPLHDQTVKDEKGRYQRFHGAFTGGFSAGYFNTVGSKEGWTPSAFVSSRQQKAERQNARPEDFMDEEDFSEHGIAPRVITTSEEFSSGRRDAAAEKKRAVSSQSAVIPGDTLLEDLITPARSSIGVELLRRMGWREGQGVGPRVKKRKARRQQTDSGAKVYSCAPPPPAGSEESEDDDDDEFAPENVTFAPKDVTPVDFTPRLGLQGLGYRGLDPGLALLGRGGPEHPDLFRPETDGRNFGDKSRRRRGGVAGQAFGIGALEEDDDEDIYHRDSMSRYDTVLGGEEPGDGLYGWTAPQQYTKNTNRSKDASYLGKILEGFTLAQKPAQEKTIFPPPVLPRDYRPVHRLRAPLAVSALSGVSPVLAQALRTSRGHMKGPEEPQQAGRHQLDSGQRGALLGEDGLKGPSSVMELLRPEDRQRLLSLRNSSGVPAAAAVGAVVASSSSSSWSVPPSPSSGPQQQQDSIMAAWRGVHTSSQSFRPFEKNPSKQARYDRYLDLLRQGVKDAVDQSLDPSMTEWERGREREEFVRASVLYRPSSSSLSSRFTRGRHTEDDQDTVEVNRDDEGDVDDKASAVKIKMFGKLTRETFEWHPDKLLCKRFNVPDPYPGSALTGQPKVRRDKFSVFNFLTVTDSCQPSAAPKPPDPVKKSRWDVSEQMMRQEEKTVTELNEPAAAAQLQPDATKEEHAAADAPEEAAADRTQKKSAEQKGDEEEEEEEEEVRPPMDLFKAIFASSEDEKESSSSSEGDSEEEEGQEAKEDRGGGGGGAEALNLFNITSSSVTASSSSSSVTTAPSSQLTAAASSRTSTREEEQEFGPRLPPPSAAPVRGAAEEEKVRSSEKKHKNKKQHKHKKDKKKKKQKKQKYKLKEEKKKRRSRKETPDSSGEDGDEDRPVSTQELLRRLKEVRSRQPW
ncbi:G patch domain-containing protein 1 isoform 3-T3 [Pholidichthys leucotaenia]